MKLFDLFKRGASASPPARTQAAAPAPEPGPEPARAMSFTVLDDQGGATRFVPAEATGQIHAASRALSAQIAPGAAVGLLFRSSVELIATWFACVNAGLVPLIMQYPTRKQSRAYWYDSVTNTIATAGLAAIIADEYCAGLGLPDTLAIIRHAALPSAPVADPGALLPESFSILQLSSGTTGYRKAMALTSAMLTRHAQDLNQVLRQTQAQDVIVSWLPLYHDMGYVACFVVPILLGIDVVMMDPLTWVEQPGMLFDAIERYAGTICYMPNFAFEVMTRAPARKLPGMRLWISCAEPVSAVTARKFCTHIDADPALFHPMYGMAENVFGVTFGTGFETTSFDGADLVNCGPPIPGVELKIVEGEIHVRSPTAVLAYLGGESIEDAEGYYRTGDIGHLVDGQLYVAGRKQDVLIQAGRKFMLSDLDLRLNEAYPDIRGRAAALAIHDERLGTETPLILIEAQDFHDRTDMAQIAARMTDLTGIDQIEIAYVPPRFLTKTSSGKFNRRKSRADWLAVQQARQRGAGPRDPARELERSFSQIDWSRPMREVLDSLSTTIVAITLESAGLAFDSAKSLAEVIEQCRAAAAAAGPASEAEAPSIRIVSLADRRVVRRLSEADLAAMEQALGCKVTFEHVCLPPSAILLSDLVFHDWFQPRLDQAAFAAIDQAMAALRGASVILVDAISEFYYLYESVYPALSHNLERNPLADLICFRWQNYTSGHDRLPLTYVCGREIPLAAANATLGQLQRYLGTPIFRIASVPGYAEFTKDWEFAYAFNGPDAKLDWDRLIAALTDFIARNPDVRRPPLRGGPPIIRSDLAHFCSVMARKQAVEKTLAKFDSFYLGAPAASMPYLTRRLDELGKPYARTISYAPEVMKTLPQGYECLLTCGSWGLPPAGLPVIAFQHVVFSRNRVDPAGSGKKLNDLLPLNVTPPTPSDWYCTFALDPENTDREAWRAGRISLAAQRPARRPRILGPAKPEAEHHADHDDALEDAYD